mgnify:CR=1 FL=1
MDFITKNELYIYIVLVMISIFSSFIIEKGLINDIIIVTVFLTVLTIKLIVITKKRKIR